MTEQPPTEEPKFRLPIAFLERKTELEAHTKNDLELSPLDPSGSLYKYVFNPETIFGAKTMGEWCKYYTADVTFLKESQTLLKNKAACEHVSGETQRKVDAIWREIKSETGFNEKYNYLDWSKLNMLNNSANFLQCLSLYNMAAPVLSLMLPIFFLILPMFILKMRGMPITIEKYIELLKIVFKKHQLGQIFDISTVSFEKMVYILATTVFYVLQVYQNIMSCVRFYHNMAKIHYQLFTIRDYLSSTLKNMDALKSQCDGLKTYEPFLEHMKSHRDVCEVMLKDLKIIVPNKITIKKFTQIGHTMKCFYQLYNHSQFHETLEYSFGLNGYIDNLNGFRKNIELKHVGSCSFKKANVKFKNAYFPSLVNQKPVKNSYKLDKHLLITGPNAAGKTTLLKTTIFNVILSQQLGYGFYKKANLLPYDRIHCYINIPDTSSRDSLFQAEAKRCKDILDEIDATCQKDELSQKDGLRHFCVFDELYSGTNPYEAISSAYAFLKYLNKYDNVNFILTTHFLDLCRRLAETKEMKNYHMRIDTTTGDFTYTYKMEKGISYIKGGIKVLRDLDYPEEIINVTNETLREMEI